MILYFQFMNKIHLLYYHVYIMVSMQLLKRLIMAAIIISYVATYLNQLGILQYPFGASNGTIWDIGSIIGLVFAIIAIRLVLMVPEKQPA